MDFTIEQIEQQLATMKAPCLDLLAQSGAAEKAMQCAADDEERTRLLFEQIDLMEKSDVVWAKREVVKDYLARRKVLEAAQEKI